MPESLRFAPFVGWFFQTVIIAIGAWGVSELSSLSQSVQELNVKMAVAMERDQVKGEEIRDLKSRVDRLEAK